MQQRVYKKPIHVSISSAEAATTGGGLGRLRTDHCRKGDRPAEEATPGLCQGQRTAL